MSNIHSKMLQVAQALNEGIAKGGRNVDQGYSFRGIDQVMDALHGPLVDAGIVFLPAYELLAIEDRPTKSGGTMQYARVQGTFQFACDDGGLLTVSTVGQGNDTSDKAVNKAMSAALKYALLQTFMVPIGDDDGDTSTIEMGGDRGAPVYDTAERGIPVDRVRKPYQPSGNSGGGGGWETATPDEVAYIKKAAAMHPDNDFMGSIARRLDEKGEWSTKQKASALKTAKDLIGPMPRGGTTDGAARIADAFPGAKDISGMEPF